MIENYFLQSNEFNIIIRQIFGGSVSEGIAVLAPLISIGIIVGLVGLIGLIAYRATKQISDFGEGIPKGKFRMINIADGSIQEGYLAVNRQYRTKEDLNAWMEIEELKPLAERILQLLEEESLFLYDFNKIDVQSLLHKNAKRIRIFSPVKLESDEYSWQDQQGNRSIDSLLNKQYVRNFVTYMNTEYEEMPNEDGNIDGYYFVQVLPIVDLKKQKTLLSGKPDQKIEITISPQTIEGGKHLAMASSFIKTIAETHRKLTYSKTHEQKIQELLTKEQQRNYALKMKVHRLRRLLTQQVLIGFAKPLTPLQKGVEYGWIAGCGFAVLIVMTIVPDMDVVKQSNTPPLLIGGVAVAVVLLLRYLFETRFKPMEQKDLEEAPENVEKIE